MEQQGELEELSAADRDGPELRGAFARIRGRLLSPGDNTRPTAPPADDDLPESSRVGRYVVVKTLGMGGMGMVLRAYDPKLGREVALKRLLDTELASSRDRLFREAQAMAKLNHPNVVSVYDVESKDDALVIAMEYVPGGDLQDWLRTERPVDEVLRRFVQAGRGLAAAHAVGLVHRDFKPANVLLGKGGESKVGDFGLAKAAGRALPTPTAEPADVLTTAPGVVMGTPRYMAPEQAAGHAADARSDQYAFCVALWEALCGEPPFPGCDPETIQEAKRKGPPAWPSARAVPRRCIDAIRRGLHTEPTQRFATMEELLDALAPRRYAQRAVAGMAVAGFAGALAFAMTPREDVCDEDRRSVESDWEDRRRPALLEHLGSVDVPFAESMRTGAQRQLDRFIDRWLDLHAQACVPGAGEAPSNNVELACLELGKSKWDATLDGLARVDATNAAQALTLVERLPDLDGCMDVERLDALGLGIAEGSDRRTLQSMQAALHAMEVAGRLGDFERAEQALEEAEALAGDDPRRALRAREGRLLLAVQRSDFATAIELGETLRTDALEAGLWPVAARAGNRLGALLVIVGNQPERGLEISRSAVLESVGAGLGPHDQAVAHSNYASALLGANQPEAGMEQLRKAIAVREQAGLGESRNQAHNYMLLGRALTDAGKFVEGADALLFGFDLAETVLGPDHPQTLAMQADCGVTLSVLGMTTRAVLILRRALEAAEKTHGPQSRMAFVARDNLGVVLSANGRPEEAAALLEPGLAGKIEAYGADHPQTRFTRVALAGARLRSGDRQRAIEDLTPIVEGEGADDLMANDLLGIALAEVGRLEEAKERLAHGLSVAESTLAPRAELRIGLALEWARVSVGLGQRAAALERVEPLWTLVTEPPATAELRADVAEVYLLALGEDDPERAGEVRRMGAAACRALESTDGAPACSVLLDEVPLGDRATD